MSQAPGLSGTPDSGHCSSAATRASCARSSASPTSRTMRVRAAMSLGDSILHNASMVGWIPVATATQQTIPEFHRARQEFINRLSCLGRAHPLVHVFSKVFRPENLADLGLALPSGPVLPVKFHEL